MPLANLLHLSLIIGFSVGAGAQEAGSYKSAQSAENFYLPTDAIGISPLSGKVVGVSQVPGGYSLAIELTAKNCSDLISPVYFAEAEGVVTISVWNIARKLSYVSPCSSHPTYRQEILVRSAHPFVKAVFLGN